MTTMVTGGKSADVILPASSVVVQPLIPKLGHEVEEIRVRAAKNILFKLDHKLVCVSDLVHERHLLISLLEWFNFSSVPLKREVLGLLERLAKEAAHCSSLFHKHFQHVAAAQTLLSVGGVEFLSHLRQDTDPELYQSIDDVIHQLLSLPQETGSKHEQWCLYKSHDAHEKDKLHQDVELSSGHSHVGGESLQPARMQAPASITEMLQSNPAGRSSRITCCQVSPAQGFFPEQNNSSGKEQHQQEAGFKCSTEKAPFSAGRFHESSYADTSRLMFFPWLSLTASDRHILSATNSRLQSRSPSLVAKSCEFLSDVLFKDFPAQIFLQRPSVFQSLLELLDEPAAVEDGACLPLSAILCLKDLCRHLQARLSALADSALHCSDQDCWKSRLVTIAANSEAPVEGPGHDVATGVRERGDGGLGSSDEASSASSERPSSASPAEEDEDGLLTETLRFNQLSVEQFCVTLLARLVPLPQGRLGSKPVVMATLVELLHHVLELLRVVVPDGLWQDKCHASTLMAPSLLSSMRGLGEAVVHHMREAGRLGPDPAAPHRAHSLLGHWLGAVNLASVLVQLLGLAVPLDMASRVIPSELSTVIWLLTADGSLGQTHPHLRRALLRYLAAVDPSSHAAYLAATTVAEAMGCTCKFLKARRLKADEPLSGQLELASRSLPSLAYHRSAEYVTEAVQLCSRASQAGGQARTAADTAQGITLQLLSHPDHVVRGHVYRDCLAVVRGALRVSHVTEPQSTVCQQALFLLSPAAVYQLCAFGLYDADKTVRGAATELLSTLLLGRLSMSGNMWKRLLESLIPPLAHLQGSVGLDPTLDQSLLETVCSHSGHVTAEGDLIGLPLLERLRGTLRFMFVQDAKTRARAFEFLVLLLSKEGGGDGSGAQGWWCRHVASTQNAGDVFIADRLTCSVYSHSPVAHSTVNSDEVRKLYAIFNSRSVDVGLRKSSAQQLAIILQDPKWHEILLSENADEVALAVLKDIIEVEGPLHTPTTPRPRVELVLPCLAMIRLLAEYNAACRRRLAQRFSVYSIVTKCVLLCQHTAHVQYEASCLMVLLLFSEVAMVTPQTEDSIPFSLPSSLVKRYQFPFNPPVHTAVSAHQVPGPQEPDPLKSEPAVSILRIAWNLGWHESLERLCQIKGAEDGGANEAGRCLPALQWRALDQQLLRAGHVTTALTEILESITSAASHHAVGAALTRLTQHLSTDLGAWDGKRHLAVEVLYSLRFDEALERYLQVVPSSPQDDELLMRVLTFLELLLTSPLLPPQPVVAWMARIVLQSEGPLLTLLRTVPEHAPLVHQSAVESKKALRRRVVSFFAVFVRCLSRHATAWRLDGERVSVGDLAHALALNLDLADNPQYYELPVLQTALRGLACVTAQPHWSERCRAKDGAALCSQMLASLVQVVTAFHAGRLGASTSFMGKGVTLHAGLCLVHLAHEMAATDGEAWTAQWLQSQDEPLSWLLPLVTDRWPEVRWVGLSVATMLVRTARGRRAVLEASEDTGGGLWNLAFSIVLDDGECGLVRQQATLLLCTLTSSMGLSAESSTAETAQDAEETVMDVDQLLPLLDKLGFFRKVSVLLSNTADAMPTSQSTSRACQSSASVSRPASSNSEFPYKPLPSTSQSASVSSEVTQSAVLSPSLTSAESNGVLSISGHPVGARAGGTPISGGSSAQGSHWTQPSQTPTSMVPLFDERGLPSGMSNTSTSSWLASVSESTASVSERMTSVVTSGLVSAVSRLLYNLIAVAPEKICAALNSATMDKVLQLHLESSGLQKFLEFYLTSGSDLPRWAEVMVPEVLGMYSIVVTSLAALVRADHTVLFRVQQDQQLLHRVLALLAISVSDFAPCLQEHVVGVRAAVAGFLVTLLRCQGAMLVPSQAERALSQHWPHFTAALVDALKTPTPPPLRSALLNVLSLLLAAEGKRERDHKRKQQPSGARTDHLVVILDTVTCSEQDARDGNADPRDTQQEVEPSGSELCRVLIGAHEDGQLRPATQAAHGQKARVTAALSLLLTVSRAAKGAALRAGLVETTLEHIKHLHVQLNVSSLQLGTGPSWKRKDNPLTTELISLLTLLKNFMYHSAAGKAACAESGLVAVLHKLWAWCTVEQTLLAAVVSLLCTMTAGSTRACALFAGNNSSVLGGTTFMQSLLKFAAKTSRKVQDLSACAELDRHVTTMGALFSLLGNLALSAECRGVVWKNNFLQHFSTLKPLKNNQTKHRSAARSLAQAWLSLLVNVTWFTDGQQMVTKTTAAPDVLLELSHARHTKHVQERALLVLRNLCFHAASKPVLLAGERVVATFIESLSSGSLYTRALAVSALCALLHNCHKAKVSLKTAGLLNKLDEIKLQTVDADWSADDKFYKRFREGLQRLEKAFREQNSISGI